MWWAGVSQAISSCVSSISKIFVTSKEKQLETELIKEKRSYKEGLDIAEKMIALIAKYIEGFSEVDKKKFAKLYDDFMEKN